MSTNPNRFTPHEVIHDVVDRAILVGVDRGRGGGWALEDDLEELGRLTDTAGAVIVGTVTQKLDHPHPRTFVGKGKVEEIATLVGETEATLVVFDDDLTPSQQSNIENELPKIKVLDRTALILDIFALHAKSREGRLQVELAQMEYLLPRLRGLWRHFGQAAAASGGALGIGTRGPGETQLETDRRLARTRIQELKRELKQVSKNRDTQRHARARSGVFRIALVGYTNAGKSTLLNALTGADVLVEDKLFATLDATTRHLELPEGRGVTITDTVGFINKLPHGLVNAFKSTLDEVREADLLVHVIDASHSMAGAQIAAVSEVLGELDVAGTPQLLAFNKIDLVDAAEVAHLRDLNPGAVFVSGAENTGLDDLLARVAAEASRSETTLDVLIPYTRGELVRLAHEQGHIMAEEHTAEGTRLNVRVPASIAAALAPFAVSDR
ncbi:MAG: GTPase HflX [Actinomycetota bacterium]|nr:MAG: GTP-binding [Actinomycetota bacterium]MDO8949930.1 GTPase HflX [Actinomycetota bacterium]MDP3631165.1 GTPase HflX [Actinomycetota bacterium]